MTTINEILSATPLRSRKVVEMKRRPPYHLRRAMVAVMEAFPTMRNDLGWGWEYHGGPAAEWLVYEPGMDWRTESLDFDSVEEAAHYIWEHSR